MYIYDVHLPCTFTMYIYHVPVPVKVPVCDGTIGDVVVDQDSCNAPLKDTCNLFKKLVIHKHVD